MITRRKIRQAAAALEHLVEEDVIEQQVRYADIAHRALDEARQFAEARLNIAAKQPMAAARAIAQRAALLDLDEIHALERRLEDVERRVAGVSSATSDGGDSQKRPSAHD